MLLVRKKLPAIFLAVASILCLGASAPSFAQNWQGRGPDGPMGGPMERSFRGPYHGRWWDNPELAQKIGLTDAQKKQMDDIFFKNRLQLIDLNAALQKDQLLLRPLLGADQLDEAKILSQIDAIAQDRANLEKANARMLFGIRKVLTLDQWTKLKTIVRNHRAMRGRRMGQRRWQGRGPAGPGSGAPPPPPGAGDPNNGSAPPPPPLPNAQPNQ
ncbi:MAG TPA: Spy/CpxP family protein refolding chaperone [Acidobacteriaceae bacterium]|nr:Spy/CpxP family protein refolding chaperone [Acidobacteriaceae bacterium]